MNNLHSLGTEQRERACSVDGASKEEVLIQI